MNIPWFIKFMISRIQRETTIVERKRENISTEPFILNPLGAKPVLEVIHRAQRKARSGRGRAPHPVFMTGGGRFGLECPQWAAGTVERAEQSLHVPPKELPEPHCSGAGHQLPWNVPGSDHCPLRGF